MSGCGHEAIIAELKGSINDLETGLARSGANPNGNFYNIYGGHLPDTYGTPAILAFTQQFAHAGLTDTAAYIPPIITPFETTYTASFDSGNPIPYNSTAQEYRTSKPEIVIVEVPIATQTAETIFEEVKAETNAKSSVTVPIQIPEYITNPQIIPALHTGYEPMLKIRN